jgi:DNA polymerase-3 subunit delta'
MASALSGALADADTNEISGLCEAGQGSPGRAIAFRGLDIAALDATLDELIARGDATNARRSQLAQALSSKAAQPRYEAFLSRAPSVIAAAAKTRQGPALAQALMLWERASELAGSATRLSLDPQVVTFELAGMVAALAPEQKDRG